MTAFNTAAYLNRLLHKISLIKDQGHKILKFIYWAFTGSLILVLIVSKYEVIFFGIDSGNFFTAIIIIPGIAGLIYAIVNNIKSEALFYNTYDWDYSIFSY